MWTIVFKFGLDPGLRAVDTSLRGMRGADGHIQCGVGVAQSRGEDVGGPQIRARNEAGYLHLRGVITPLRCCMNERGYSVVTTRGLSQSAARGVGRTRVQDDRVASSAGDKWVLHFCRQSWLVTADPHRKACQAIGLQTFPRVIALIQTGNEWVLHFCRQSWLVTADPHRKACQAIGLQTFPRVIALIQTDMNHERILVPPRWCALLHWQSVPSRRSAPPQCVHFF